MLGLSSLIRHIKLRLHRRGHGVHSPFAFRMVRDVITNQGYYYSTARLERLTLGFPKQLKKEYRLLFRLIARLSPKDVRISNSIEPQMELLVRMADMRPFMARGIGGYTHRKSILTICSALDFRNGLPEGVLHDSNMLFLRELNYAPEIKKEVAKEMKGGWVFSDSRSGIWISRDSEALNIIDIKLT